MYTVKCTKQFWRIPDALGKIINSNQSRLEVDYELDKMINFVYKLTYKRG